MSTSEKELIDATFRGEWAGFSALPDLSLLSPQEQADITISGTFLRELLLGLRIKKNSPPKGVRLRGVIIDGELDLSDCTGRGGAPLPSLLLEHCIIRDGNLVKWDVVFFPATHPI